MSNYQEFLEAVARDDIAALRKAQETYGNSWLMRGGVGAFMMLARKWDRLENQVKERLHLWPGTENEQYADPYDIFGHMLASTEDGIIDDVRDLRRYLILVEAEIRARRGA